MQGISVTEKRFLTVNDVKDYLGCTYYMANKIMHSKGFPSFSLDDLSDNLKPRFIVALDDFEEWLLSAKKNNRRKVR